jgi:hypothetical protein
VKFEYFHKVDELIPNKNNDQIEKMLITEQVKLKVQITAPLSKQTACLADLPSLITAKKPLFHKTTISI